MNERGIWTTKEEIGTHVFDKALCDAIIYMFPADKSIVDIGCGNGAYTEYLKRHLFTCDGFDGSPLTPEPCEIMDFSNPVNIGKYDIVLCLEVGEHIPQQFERVFIKNICNTAKEWIILSWAVEGQGGTGHVNCRNNDYVVEQMWRQRFEISRDLTDILRNKASISWFKNTLMVFKYE